MQHIRTNTKKKLSNIAIHQFALPEKIPQLNCLSNLFASMKILRILHEFLQFAVFSYFFSIFLQNSFIIHIHVCVWKLLLFMQPSDELHNCLF